MTRWRFGVLLLVVCMVAVVVRLVYLQIIQQHFLQKHSDERTVRQVVINAPRGMIVDRNGVPLAISSPVDSIWVDPKLLERKNPHWSQVLSLMGWPTVKFNAYMAKNPNSRFVYLDRHITPQLADKVMALHVVGVQRQTEYQRFYPYGVQLANVLGFTNIDDQGQEGIELAYNDWLAGKDGLAKVVKAPRGQVVSRKVIKPMRPGQPLAISIDVRAQHLTYKALKAMVDKQRALAGSAVILDVRTGDILAMANVPSFNPNSRAIIKEGATRNRAVTDTYEPGSVMKPFAMATVLTAGAYPEDYEIDTKQGWYRIGRNTVRDSVGLGTLTFTDVLRLSSNVGISKLLLGLENPAAHPDMLRSLGFGDIPLVYPGAQSGRVPSLTNKKRFELATLTFGYGIAASTLQIAQAYAILARHGKHIPPTLLRREDVPSATEVLSPVVANKIVKMLEAVVSHRGTAIRAKIEGYRIAGKTGTARKASVGGYSANYTAMFAGIAPADNPRFVMVVMVDDPKGRLYYGGSVSAPVFRDVMRRLLPMYGILPSKSPTGR